MVKIHFTWGWSPEDAVALLGAGYSRETILANIEHAAFIGLLFGMISVTWETAT